MLYGLTPKVPTTLGASVILPYSLPLSPGGYLHTELRESIRAQALRHD